MVETYEKELLRYKRETLMIKKTCQVHVEKSKTLWKISVIPNEIPLGMMQEAFWENKQTNKARSSLEKKNFETFPVKCPLQ